MAPSDVDAALTLAAARFARLKRTYERYWSGLERPEPVLERESLRQAYVALRGQADGHNLATSFRVKTAQASFLAFDEMCTRRAARELDDVSKRLRTRRPAAQPSEGPATSHLQRSARPAEPAASLAAAPTTSRSAGDTGLGQTAHDALYAQLSATLMRRGQKGLSRQQFSAQVLAHLAAAQQKSPGVAFAVKLREQPDGRMQLVVEADAGPSGTASDR